MLFLLVVFFLGSSVVLVRSYSQDRTTFSLADRSGYFRNNWRTPKFIDVYTNYADQKEVENAYYENYNLRSHNRRSYSPDYLADRRDSLNFQIVDNLFSSTGRDSLESEYGHIQSNRFSDTGPYIDNKKHPHYKDDYSQSYHNGKKYQPFDSQNKYQTENKDKYRPKLLTDKDRNNFVYVQSQMSVPDTENFGSFYASSDSSLDDQKVLRPNSVKIKYNSTGGSFMVSGEDLELTTRRYAVSYIQKIPSIRIRNTSTIAPDIFGNSTNRYEEVELTEKLQEKNVQVPDTKKRINNLLKTYIANLFVEKYAHKTEDDKNEETANDSLLKKNDIPYLNAQNSSDLSKDTKSEQESKFLFTNTLWDLKNKTVNKIKNLFGIFTIIKFNNTECNATNWAGTWQGFCYTSIECSHMNGTALGSCANGYGVCCAFRGSCGDSSNRNCTYFKSPNYPDFYPSNGGGVVTPSTSTMSPVLPTPDPRIYWYHYNQGDGDLELDDVIEGKISSADPVSCSFAVYKINSNVKQMKIDFVDLDLASPTNGTCATERLVITGQNTNDPIPVICGYNTGQHVYVDVSQLNGPLQLMVLSTTGVRKRFKLRICQYTDSCSTAQSNCLQYYTGVSGIIESFNYDQAAMFNRSTPGYFNNLNYAICIRREAGYCSVTYTNVRNGQVFPFQLVNRLPNGLLTVPLGQAGVDILNCPDDYIVIEGTRLCGDRFNDGSTLFNFAMNAPVTDMSAGPIVVNVRTNNNVTGLGFKLYYMQNLCTTT